MALDLSGFDNVLEEDVYNGEMGHAHKHNQVNDQVNFLTEQLARGMVVDLDSYSDLVVGEDWTNAFNAAADDLVDAGGGDIVARGRAYRFLSPIVVPDYIRVRGAWSRRYTGNPTTGARFYWDDPTITGALVTLNRGAALCDISVIGAGKSSSTQHDGIKIAAGLVTINAVTVTACKNGIDVNYKSVNQITLCQIHDNQGYGVIDPVDSQITGCYINVNSAGGIRLAAGANDNLVQGNKIEFNGISSTSAGRGINCTGAVNNKIIANVIDRNGGSGIRLASSCTNTVISGNIFRRNGRYATVATAPTEEDVHIWTQGSSKIAVIGNVFRTGADDDGSGYTSPAYVAGGFSNDAQAWLGNQTDAGGLTGLFNFTSDTNGRYLGNTGVLDAAVGVSRYGLSGGSGNTAAAATWTATIRTSGVALTTFNPGYSVSIDLLSRSTTGGTTRRMATVRAVIGRESGNAFVTLGAVVNHIGADFATAGGTHTVSATVSTDGRDLTINILNNSADVQQYRADVR